VIQQVSRNLQTLPRVVTGQAAKISTAARHYRDVMAREGPIGLARATTTDVAREGVLLVRGSWRLTSGLLSRTRPISGPAEAVRPPAVATKEAAAAGAPGVATEAADREELRRQPAPGAALQPADLPLDDYDHLTLGSLRARLRGLTVDDLLALRAYERAHANRLPIITMLENRIAKLEAGPADESAPLGSTGGRPDQS